MPLTDTWPRAAAPNRATLARVAARVLPNGYACWRVEIVLDGDERSGAVPFAGFRGHAYGKRNADALAGRERRAAAAALAAYEAEHGDWRTAAAAREAAAAEATCARAVRIAPDEAMARVDAMLARLAGKAARSRARRRAGRGAP